MRLHPGLSALAVLLAAACTSDITPPGATPLQPALPNATRVNVPGVDRADLFIKSVIALDPVTGNVTLPLFKGRHNGEDVWYIVTESSDKDDAERRGINAAPKLANALGTAAVQRATEASGVVTFAGTVDFSPTRVVVPGPEGFPPASFSPGARGDASYSPLYTTGGGIVLNASHVANASGLHDAIVSIDYDARRVTLQQFRGFYDDKEVLYLHQDGSIELVAALEGSTFAPNLNAAPGLGSDDRETSAREAIIPVVNGPLGVSNPERQGLRSALLGEGEPLNIIQEEPGDNDYSPVWDLHLAVWTDAAIAAGKRERLTGTGELENAIKKGYVVSGGDGPRNPSLGGLRAANGISNCPVTAQLGRSRRARGGGN